MDGMVVRAWGSNVDDGYEVIATRDLPVGHHVFEVPRDVAVRLDSTHSDFKERIRDHPNFWDNCAFREGSRPFVELTVMALYVGSARPHVAQLTLFAQVRSVLRAELFLEALLGHHASQLRPHAQQWRLHPTVRAVQLLY